jgi:4-hydroxy-tetrahydrodipicolinate reductase
VETDGRSTGDEPLRVVQWATGNIGMRSLRQVIEHPRLQLVGLFVYDRDKVGADAGELCGLGPIGVRATDDRDAIVGLAPDCVLHMARFADVDLLCHLLERGIDVVTTAGLFHHPAGIDPELRTRVEAACAAGGSTIHATGSSPGFITEAVPVALASIQRRIDRLLVEEYADMSRRDSPELLFEIMGYGRPPGPSDDGRANHLRDSFGPSLRLLADAFATPLDEVVAAGEVAVAATTTSIAAGTVEAGTVAAQRTTVSGMRGGRAFLEFRATWYVTDQLEPAWSVSPTGWRITVDGDAPLAVDMPFPFGLEEMAERSPGYTANRAVNAVAVVCAAAPGIASTLDLPPIVPDLRPPTS